MHKVYYSKKNERFQVIFRHFVLEDWIRSLRSRIQVPLLESTNNQQLSLLAAALFSIVPSRLQVNLRGLSQ